MSTVLAATLACLLSLPSLLWLAWRDPKRLRSQRRRPSARQHPRGIAAFALLVPGMVLASGGLWPAFLLWIGIVAVSGWLLTLSLAQTRNRQSR